MGKRIGLLGLGLAGLLGCAGVSEREQDRGDSLSEAHEGYFVNAGGAGTIMVQGREIESLPVEATSGDPYFSVTHEEYSSDVGQRFMANSIGDFVVLDLGPPSVTNAHNLIVRVRPVSNGGQFQVMSSGSATGPWTNIGSIVEGFDLGDGTTIADLGPVNLPVGGAGSGGSGSGRSYLKFEVVGKNPASSSYWLCLDALYWLP